MDISNLPREVKYYGKRDKPVAPVSLKSGSLSLLYDEGNLRYIRLGKFEVLRMIYSAVRDKNWGTVAPVITNEIISTYSDSFEISYQADYQQDNIHFIAQYILSGDEEGNIRFEMDGKALSTFQKNRLGFCILHPVAECVGQECIITDTQGKKYDGVFPKQISPHQPFKDMKSIQWKVKDQLSAQVSFEGDVFEMEDQRNWTDDSYKTYCTPLELPFPATVKEGENIRQVISLNWSDQLPEDFDQDQKLSFEIFEEQPSQKLPAIGIARSSEVQQLSEEELKFLQKIKFQHYRVDLELFKKDWSEHFQNAIQEAKKLGYPLELALHFKDEPEKELEALLSELATLNPDVKNVMFFSKNSKTTPADLISQVLPDLRKSLPKANIGAGTDAFFTELNRERIDTGNIDFVSFSINPQVHHFDNASLVETLKAQSYTVESAQYFSNCPIHVTPVSLKMRWNPNATGPEPVPAKGALPNSVDVRQMSLFAGGWTIGSIKYLAEAETASVTYFETVGQKGIFMGESGSEVPDQFLAEPFSCYPMYFVFKEILNLPGWTVVPTLSSNHLLVDGLLLEKEGQKKLFLVNYTEKKQEIELDRLKALRVLISYYDEHNFIDFFKNPDYKNVVEMTIVDQKLKVELNPYAFVSIEFLLK